MIQWRHIHLKYNNVLYYKTLIFQRFMYFPKIITSIIIFTLMQVQMPIKQKLLNISWTVWVW